MLLLRFLMCKSEFDVVGHGNHIGLILAAKQRRPEGFVLSSGVVRYCNRKLLPSARCHVKQPSIDTAPAALQFLFALCVGRHSPPSKPCSSCSDCDASAAGSSSSTHSPRGPQLNHANSPISGDGNGRVLRDVRST